MTVVLWMVFVAGSWTVPPVTYATKEQCVEKGQIAVDAMEPEKRSEWVCMPVTFTQSNKKSAKELDRTP